MQTINLQAATLTMAYIKATDAVRGTRGTVYVRARINDVVATWVATDGRLGRGDLEPVEASR